MKTTYKLGQEVTFKSNFEIEATISKTKLKVKEGDKALITKSGFKVLTGEARGKTLWFNENEEAKGYDYSNISKLIFDTVNREFGLKMLFEDEGIEIDNFIEEIEDLLMDIL